MARNVEDAPCDDQDKRPVVTPAQLDGLNHGGLPRTALPSRRTDRRPTHHYSGRSSRPILECHTLLKPARQAICRRKGQCARERTEGGGRTGAERDLNLGGSCGGISSGAHRGFAALLARKTGDRGSLLVSIRIRLRSVDPRLRRLLCGLAPPARNASQTTNLLLTVPEAEPPARGEGIFPAGRAQPFRRAGGRARFARRQLRWDSLRRAPRIRRTAASQNH